ncbi:MAG: efflux RND transporter permease subunit [Prevotellaceae bacterium]|jgi:multidrug efflux pump subunit AcrB|nr:efflux RND transporter permease subunit [Prevotellaceae bacterium]
MEQNKNHSFTFIVAFVALALVGLALIPLLPVKLNPSRTLPGFSVQFSMSGASSRVVEMEATSKLEAMLARIKGVRRITSTSGNGYGSINVDLDKHVDVDVARFEASTIIRQTWSSLPKEVGYPEIQMWVPDGSDTGPFLSFTLNAPSTPILIQQYAEAYIKPRLAKLAGIYQIDVSGATPMEWRLEYDSRQLRTLGITPSDIRSAIALRYNREFLGTYDMQTSAGKQWIRLMLVPDTKPANERFDASAISLTGADGRLIRLDELVSVAHVEEPPQRYYRINGLNSIYLSITAEERANQLQLASAVRHEMGNIRRHLPAGYQVHTGYDATEYIRAELNKIYFRTGLTVLILLLFVWLTTFNRRYLFLIVVSLAVNLAIALIFYYLLGLEMQLYSLAGITISLNLVIDSTIVMTDHILHRRNLKAFLSILAATLTTMGALVIIFFLDEEIRLNLQDFAAVMMVNLTVSLFVALFFVPALIDKIGLKTRKARRSPLHRFIRRTTVRFTHLYQVLIYYMLRWRIVLFFVLAAAFGGTLYLFITKVYNGSYFTRNAEVVLSATANLPHGNTLEQMNTLVKRMESYLSEFKEIRQFHTTVYSGQQASISIYFKKEYEHGGFPYRLKSNMISKALQLGGGSWNISGLQQDQGFSNDVHESAGSSRIKMYGYNYDELYAHAEALKTRLLTYRRIKEVTINSEFSYAKEDYREFYFDPYRERMAEANVSFDQLYTDIRPVFGRNMEAAVLPTRNGSERIRLSSRQSGEYDVWALQNMPFQTNDGRYYKPVELATITIGQAPQKIAKENQQYRLCLQYEYIGSYEQSEKVQKRELEEFNKTLPMGYSATSERSYWSWREKGYREYLLLGIVAAIIFFMASILFNSLKQPLAIIFIIPISYIGVFLTFYWFGLNFDQGGFASFVLLCGITVNAGIYVLNEYNTLRRRYPHLSPLRAYTRAWNAKAIPIFLTVVSTILGFIPFMVGLEREGFWFPLAAGTIGGLVMSVIGIFFFLPLLCLKRIKKTKSRRKDELASATS